MKKFTEFKNEEELKDFNDYAADLHDGRIKEISCKLGYCKNKAKGYYGEIYSLKIKIEDVYFAEPKYKPESLVAPEGCEFKGVELLFEDIEKMFFSPAGKNCYMFIFDALLVYKDGKFILNAFDDSQKLTNLDTCNLYVMSEKLSYRLF